MQNNFFRNKKVLVTGANGFIGSHMVARMARENADISAAVRESSDIWRLKELSGLYDLHYFDLTDPLSIDRCIKKIKPEYVFHFGAYGVDARQNDCCKAVNANIYGTINLICSLSKTNSCVKLINTGSCAEYGNKPEAIKESDTLEPCSIYGSTKAAAVLIAHQLASEKRINITTLRSFGVFGEKEGSHKFFPYLILSTLNKKPADLTLCEQYRDYCYIDNIIDGFLLAASNTAALNRIYNIGSGNAYPMKYYAGLIYKQMKTDSVPRYGAVPYRENEMWKQQADITKIKSELEWKPEISLEEGIIRTISWYRNNCETYHMTMGR